MLDNTNTILKENENDRHYKDRENLEKLLLSVRDLKEETEEIMKINIDEPPESLMKSLISDGKLPNLEDVKKELINLRREQLAKVDDFYEHLMGNKPKKEQKEKKQQKVKKQKVEEVVKKDEKWYHSEWNIFVVSFVVLAFLTVFFKFIRNEKDHYLEDY